MRTRTELRATELRATGLLAIVLLALALLPLAGCGSGSGALNGTRWRLTGWTLSSLNPADFTITAQFAGGRISGKSAVNSYSGSVKLGPGQAFATGALAGTKMAGPEPAMRAESAYLALLAQARSWERTDNRLTLKDGGGNESLIFEPAAP